VTTPPREPEGFSGQPLLELDPVSRLPVPPGPSGPAASAGGSSSERLTACLVRRPPTPAGLDTSQALRDGGDSVTVARACVGVY
jgi:hypothetical protein